MTIRRVEKPVPTLLPAARLYIDDIEEVVRILSEAADGLPVEGGKRGLEISISVGDRVCDDVCDLPQIAKRSEDFEMRLVREQCGYTARLGLSGLIEPIWQWTTTGLPYERAWSVFHKLESVFGDRKPRAVWRRPPGLLSPLILLVGCVLTGMLLGYSGFARNVSAGFGALAIWLLILYDTLSRKYGRSVVIFHSHLDEAGHRREAAWKILPTALNLIIGFALGILTLYLKHKYWP